MTLVTIALTSGELELTIHDFRARAAFADEDRQELTEVSRDYAAGTSGLANEQIVARAGTRLTDWLETKGPGWHTSILTRCQTCIRLEILSSGKPTPDQRLLLEAPWELLRDRAGGVLAADTKIPYIPIRRIGGRASVRAPQPGMLSVLFMAAAPRDQITLDFEGEEARILEAATGLGFDLFVEETGTADELGRQAALLDQPGGNALHVVHLSCHGQTLPEPVLVLEDDVGGSAPTSAAMLTEALGPELLGRLGLLFSSACLTAAAGGPWADRDSMAAACVRAGVEAMLGWAGQVHDEVATEFAVELYRRLPATEVELAVAEARSALISTQMEGGQWHLARLYLGPRGGGQLANSNGPPRRRPAVHRGVAGGARASALVQAREFVGRRRMLQSCIRALRGPACPGVLIHGLASLGKSSLAARVVDRLGYECVVMPGAFAAIDLINTLADELGAPNWRARWHARTDTNLEEALVELVAELESSGRMLILVLDGFEAMLEPTDEATHAVKSSAQAMVGGITCAFRRAASTGRASRLLITTRHPIASELAIVSVKSFSDREASKRVRRAAASSTAAREQQQRCIAASYSNPGLLTELLSLSADDPARCEHVLTEALNLHDPTQPIESPELLESVSIRAAIEALMSLDVDEQELFRRSLFARVPLPVSIAPALAAVEEACACDAGRLLARGLWEESDDVCSGRALFPNPLAKALARRSGLDTPSIGEIRELGAAILPVLERHWAELPTGRHTAPRARAGAQVVELAGNLEKWQTLATFAPSAIALATATMQVTHARAFIKGLLQDIWAGEASASWELYDLVVELLQDDRYTEFLGSCIDLGLASLDGPVSPTRGGRLLWHRAQLHRRCGRYNDAEQDITELEGVFAADTYLRERMIAAGLRADICYERGQLDEALAIRQHEIRIYSELGDARSRALALSNVADIYARRGDTASALQIRTAEQLPTFRRLGADRELAVTMGQIADILALCGELDEALDIHRREQIPLFAKLGDDRSSAMALTQVADILVQKGLFDEALGIYREEILPLFEQMGDVRSHALTIGKLADILQDRGEFDLALSLYREEQIPVFAALGDDASLASVLGDIVDIMRVQGEYSEALRVCETEMLPFYRKVGDAQLLASAYEKHADILFMRGDYDGALRIHREHQLPIHERRGDVRAIAVTKSKIADVLEAKGELDEAMRIRRAEVLPQYERTGEPRERAVTLGGIADILVRRGQLDEAMRIHREDQLPLFEQCGDIRSRAVVMGKIASILQLRGEIDEAMRIRVEDQLPVYEKLGDRHSLAVALGGVAELLELRGHVDDALRIRVREQLPIFEALGCARDRAVVQGHIADLWTHQGKLSEADALLRAEVLPTFERLEEPASVAATLAKIANILVLRGRLDEALDIRQNRELPIHDRLGDVRARAVTLGRIANIFVKQGKLDEALLIRRGQVLPIYEQLGDIRSRAIALSNIAEIVQLQGNLREALRIHSDVLLPIYERLGDQTAAALTLEKIADILTARGQYDAALAIRRDRVLPTYAKTGDVRSLAVGRTNLALTLLQRGRAEDQKEIGELLFSAFIVTRELGFSEGDQIADILRSLGVDIDALTQS